MKHLSSSLLRFTGLLVVALAGCAAPKGETDVVPLAATAIMLPSVSLTVTTTAVPAAQLFASPLPSPTSLPAEQPTPTRLAAQISNSPLPSPPVGDLWLVYSLPQGVSFAYPPDWQINFISSFSVAGGIRSDVAIAPTAATPQVRGVSLAVYPLPPDQEATLYHEAGDIWTYRESPEFHVPWAKTVRINDLDWHLYLQGYSEAGLFVRRPDLDYLFEKGALTRADLIAVHYEKSKQLVVNMSQGLLLPDELVMLDAQGMDAMYPEQFKVLSDMLATFTFSP